MLNTFGRIDSGSWNSIVLNRKTKVSWIGTRCEPDKLPITAFVQSTAPSFNSKLSASLTMVPRSALR